MDNYLPPDLTAGGWARAWRARCCPPDNELYSQVTSNTLAAHLKFCPWCRRAKLDIVTEETVPLPPDMPLSKDVPEPGQLWTINSQLTGWGEKKRYYNSPVVLLLNCDDPRLVNVLQLYDDSYFEGPDDISLGEGQTGFIEPWNRYSLCREDLGLFMGEVDVDTLCRSEAATSENSVAPKPGSLLWFFRNMEVETGFYFSTRSLAKFLNGEEEHQLIKRDTLNISPSLLGTQLHQAGLLPDTLDTQADNFKLLAHAKLPNTEFPLAASEGQETLSAILFTFSHNNLVEYTKVAYGIRQLDLEDGTLLVSGAFLDTDLNFDEFHCWWKAGKRLVPPLSGKVGCMDGFFWVAFDGHELEEFIHKRNLVLRLIQYR